MIAQIEISYEGRERLMDLIKSDTFYERACQIFPSPPDEKNRHERYAWTSELLVDLETDGRWLTENGVSFEVHKFKGTMPLKAIEPGGTVHNIYVQVPHVGLLSINEVEVEEDCCTDRLQERLNEGWRILCVCPPNAARRPDYILGRTRDKS